MLEIVDLSVSIEGKVLLENINISIEEGETYMLFGENGSGKTSLIMAIMGLGNYKVESGKIIYKGEDITGLAPYERAKRGIGIMFQRPPTIKGLKLKNMLDLIKENGNDPEEMAEQLNFSDFLNRDINRGFSGGEIKRAEILQLMVQDPDLILLDEPESGVDLVNINLIGNSLRTLLEKDHHHRERHKSGLVITHSGYILDYVEADKGCVLVNKTIWCTGNPHEIIQGIRERGYEGCLSCQK